MGALDGLLVVAIEQAVAAPLCTVRLADAGARVIKIERAGGETARHYDGAVHGTSAYFAWLNRGKESAVLDVKASDDLAVLREMLARADVLVQNLAPGAMERMGLGPASLARDFPQLIAVSIVGYGAATDYAQMKAYDMLVQAESGLCAVTGTEAVPSKVGVSIADITTGANAHAAVLEALIARGVSGRGQQIEVSMFDAMADCMAVPLLHFEHQGKITGRFGLSHASIYPYRPFTCADGTIIVAVQTNAEFARLCETALDQPDLAAREEFSSNAARTANRALLDAELEPLFAAMSVADAVRRLSDAGIAFGRYRGVDDLAEHPALRRIPTPLPDGQMAEVPRPTGRDAGFTPGAVPALGQHTDRVREEFSPD
ncbi:crotonobetainyl-CoA:carnitine CoA-transferase CaiB-like acyl-CoA transferase [Litoreibacter ponti]|uniref:Crotonobetainyl-CoA:carnitine CoA-transferase CaiB-like acyl-CoA transferase n=1 Tax=Litoreibacter ponti TaxID=1510457 RepID=A0A2T6BM09_9RHOB|nr:CaiB/BaiF CoA-transferase family protein [Litoreibacter ponti]PTX57096.1 crotonobetainyl-CoA:carnitine CoA-transferase CaiB-like acyl-CoA transferase [Litoreibacter ponti]